MIDVIASIRVKPGRLQEYLEAFKSNVSAVLAEDGCIDYYPALDVESGHPAQSKDPNMVTVVEKWRDVAALAAHSQAPHMLRLRETVGEMVEGISIKVVGKA
jgi:quinol monooxygenase YgiN